MDIVTLAAARKGGGSGGDVTKQYVDDHLALKADKTETAEYPIASTATGINPTITDSADGYVQGLTVYGRSHVSKNLFDKSNIMLNKRVSSTAGNTYTVDGYTVANFIDVTPGSTYVISGFTGGSFAEYTDSTFYTGRSWAENTSITVSNNTNRIRFDFPTSSLDQMQFELGSTPTPYEPYGAIISIGDSGSLTITTANSDSSESSTATLTTGLPYCGLPVTSGETYTDEQGQKWLADTADVESVVKRCEKVVFDGSEDWQYVSSSYETNSKIFRYTLARSIPHHNNYTKGNLICAKLISLTPREVNDELYDNCICIGNEASDNFCFVRVNGVFTAEALKTYLASNPVTVVYELAEPYEIPLTASELSALRNLRTYNPTTNVTITDAPTIDISYLLDTDNGQAVANIQNELQEQIIAIPAFIASIPEMHRNIFRGQSLGNTVTVAQLAAIADGSFDDLYVGDYWTIPVTINNTEISVNWRIADINYWKNTQNNENMPNHLAIVSDSPLYDATMFSSSYSDYTQSLMYTTNITAARTAISSAFGNNVLTHETQLGTNDTTYNDSTADLMTLLMVFGYVSQAVDEDKVRTVDNKQLALFRLAPEYINIDPTGGYWTRDVCKDHTAGEVIRRRAGMGYDSESIGVKPVFALGTPAE